MRLLIVLIFFVLSFPRLSNVFNSLLLVLNLHIDDRIVSKFSILITILVITIWSGINYKTVVAKLKSWLVKPYIKVIFGLLAVFIFTAFISSIWGINIIESLVTLMYWVLIFVVFVFLLMFWNKKYSSKLLSISLFVVFVISVIQLLSHQTDWQWKTVSSIFSTPGMVDLLFFSLKNGSHRILRPSAFMNDPNFLSIYISISVIYLFKEFEDIKYKRGKGLYIFKKFFKDKALYTIAILLGLVNLLITASRTGILILIIGLITYIFARIIFNRQEMSLASSPSNKKSSLLSSGFFLQLVDRFKFNDKSFFEHLNYAQVAIKVFKERPILGIGPGNYPQFYNQYIDKTVTFGTPHSTYLKVLAETGGLGLISFVSILGVILWKLIKSKYSIGIAVIVSIICSAIAYDSLLTPWIWIFIAIILSDIE